MATPASLSLSLCEKVLSISPYLTPLSPLCLPHKPKPSSPLSGLPIYRTRMALKFSLALALLVIWAVVQAQSAHHSHAAAPAPSAADCSSLIMNMADCLSFVSSGSTEENPMGTCCAGLKTVLKTDAECLCEAFKSSGSLGVTLNMTKAMSLPAACKVQAPPAAQCGLSLTPSGAPAGISPSSVAGGPASSTSANEQAPAPAPTNTAAALFSSISLVLGHLVVALVSCF